MGGITEPHRVVGVVVVDAVDDPVQPCAELALRLEMEDRAVDPVLGERPERVPAEEAEPRLPQRKASERECSENDDRRGEEKQRRDGPAPRESVESRGKEWRRSAQYF